MALELLFEEIKCTKNMQAPEPLLICMTKVVKLMRPTTQNVRTNDGLHKFESFKPYVETLLELLFSSGSHVAHSARKALLSFFEYFSMDIVSSRAFTRLLGCYSLNNITGKSNRRLEHINVFFLLRDMVKLSNSKESGNSRVLTLCLDFIGENISGLHQLSSASELSLGAFLKLLCSSLGVLSDQEPSLQSNFLRQLSTIVPEVSSRCMQSSGIPKYYKHKAMVLLYKLSMFRSHRAARSCLIHIQGVLRSPLSETGDENTLAKLSPFLQDDCFSSSVSSSELQRRAILTLLKALVTVNRSGFGNLKPVAGRIVSEWLFSQTNNRRQSTEELVTYLVHLYTDEDDLLLDFLVVLMDLDPSWHESQSYKEFCAVGSPLRLLHLFLAEIHYDQDVLIEFLITPSTGITFLQYLLRCLRLLKDTWPEFHLISRSIEGVSFQQSKHCLQNLHLTIERMHAKHLFPYNASVLIQRFKLMNDAFQDN